MTKEFRIFIWFMVSFVVTTTLGIGFAWYQLEQAIVIADTENMEVEWKKK
tara:strand:+ start:65 stop:214 length:150 start_codon:yes stop_codon:yes gene_type:complete